MGRSEFDKRTTDSLRDTLISTLNWGEVEHWSTRNFEVLSDKIFENTSIRLSVSTLKRFLGKVAYDSKPAPATLDAISAFIGYENYSEYCSRMDKKTNARRNFFPLKRVLLALLVGLTIAGVVATWSFMDGSNSGVDSSEVEFGVRKVTTGLPNTVVFEYDVSGIQADMIEIQQDWDSTKRHKVDPGKKVFTHYYEYPGYYNAKLVVDGFIVKEEDLFIPSNGWMSLIRNVSSSSPRYLVPDEFQSDSILKVSEAVFAEIQNHPDEVTLDFYNALEKPKYDFENFEFQANLRFSVKSGKVPCEFRKLVLFGTKMFMRIPLSVPGCTSRNRLKLGSKVFSGAENDLSALSVDAGSWAKVQLKNSSNHLSIHLDGEQVFEADLTDDFGKLAGVRISFEGAGEVRDLRLSASGNRLLALSNTQ